MFSVVVSILASVVVNIMLPIPSDMIRPGQGQGQGGGFQNSPEFRELVQKIYTLTSNIQKLSPTELYEQAASDILGVTSGFGRFFGEFERAVSLGEALATNWPNIITLGVGLIVCFAASYMMFLRSEIRPGE